MTALASTPLNGEETTLVNARRVPVDVTDNGEFQDLMDSSRFAHIQRVATLFSASQLVPAHFQGNVANCFIAMQLAFRMKIDPLMLMQQSYVVHGRPGIEAKLAIALVNSSGIFTDALDYEINGEDPSEADYRVRCFAVRKSTNKTVYGPWVDWKMVRGEKWDDKPGSKWRTIPGLMFQYRAAMFFARLHCPERLMGMQTVDELVDVGGDTVVPKVTELANKRLENKAAKAADRINQTAQPAAQKQNTPDGATADGISRVAGSDAHNNGESHREPTDGPAAPAPSGGTAPAPAAQKPAPAEAPIATHPPTQNTVSDREAFLIQVHEACTAAGLSNLSDVNARVKKWALKNGVLGKENKAGDEVKKALFDAIAKREGFFA